MKPTIRYKPVELGGMFDHFQVLAICLFTFPLLGILAIVFGNQIDQFMNTTAGALTIISVCGTFGVWRFMVIVKNW